MKPISKPNNVIIKIKVMYKKEFRGIQLKDSYIMENDLTDTMVFVAIYHIKLFGIKIGTEEVLIKN